MKEGDKASQIAEGQLEMWPKYRQLRNQVIKGIHIAIQDYYSGLIKEHKKDPKRIGKTTNKVLNKNTNSDIPLSLKVEEKGLTREPNSLEAFNHHFTSIGPKLAQKSAVRRDDDCLLNISTESNNMTFRTVDENNILDAINQLKDGKASGPHKVPITIVKDVKDFIAKPLTLIVNDSIMNGVVPDIWKLARVTPIFKSGAENDANKYRPISVMSIVSRMLERLVHDQLFDFLKANKKLTCNQSAYQQLCSTITSLITSTDYWYENMDSREISLTLCLDLKKAFDTVDHSVLMKKLHVYGIRVSAGDWFESYLKERKQYCAVNGHRSNIQKITCGIPQGSCLDPLLFIIYLNDFEVPRIVTG